MPRRPPQFRRRADLYAQLAALHRSGLPADRALKAIAEQTPAGLRPRVLQAATDVRAGCRLADAGLRYALLDAFDAHLIASGEEAGRLPSVFDGLQTYYAALERRSGKLASALAYPAAVLVVAGLVLPLPAIVGGRLPVGAYLAINAVTLLCAGLLVRALPRRLLRSARLARGALSRRLPLLGPLAADIARWTLLRRLLLLYASGVAVIRALHQLAGTEQDAAQRERAHAAAVMTENGSPLADALHSAGIVGDDLYPLLHAGEAAGRLEDALQRCVAGLGQQIDYRLDLLVEWLPRLIYGLILAGLAWVII